MAFTEAESIILVIILGTLAAIVYSLRRLVLIERRVASLDMNIEKLVKAILSEEVKIEREEKDIEKKLSKKR
jgi:hypothetical protein